MLKWLLIMEYKDIQKPIGPLLRQSNMVLQQCLQNRIKLIRNLYQSTPIREGKRIRTTFLLLLARMNGVSSPKLAPLAAAIEIFHLSSLIHDDIIDNSQLRRGMRTTSLAFGNHLSVLWGDYLFIAAFNLLREIGSPKITDLLIETSRKMIEGQILEFENSFNYRLNSRTYFEIIRKKTAALFAAIGRLVTILDGGKGQNEQALAHFGEEFGMMFQIRDDLLDIFSDQSGKDQLRDLQEGKITLPYILFRKKTGHEFTAKPSAGDAECLREKMKENGVEETTRKYINLYRSKCRDFICRYPESAYKRAFQGLLDFVVFRDY